MSEPLYSTPTEEELLAMFEAQRAARPPLGELSEEEQGMVALGVHPVMARKLTTAGRTLEEVASVIAAVKAGRTMEEVASVVAVITGERQGSQAPTP